MQVFLFTKDTAVARWLENYEKRFVAFVDRLGDRLPIARRRIYERAIGSGWALMSRYRSREHLTVVHGDAHVWNLMHPRDTTADGLRLIDWDGWRLDLAAEDLAYMMAVHWYPERRRRLETPLLRRYHEALEANGVSGYRFEALWEDYRLSVVWQLGVPVWQSALKLGPWIWWSHLERILPGVRRPRL
jgi:thiamine kinase-like enzyme